MGHCCETSEGRHSDLTEDQLDLLKKARDSLAAEQAQIAHVEPFLELAERLIGPLPPSPGEQA